MTEPGRMPRRRRRGHRPAEPPTVADQPVEAGADPAQPVTPTSADARPVRRRAPGRAPVKSRAGHPAEQSTASAAGRDPDRGWRELAGNAPSQVGISGALRARDVARPDEAELAAAERDLVIIRRQWQPPPEQAG